MLNPLSMIQEKPYSAEDAEWDDFVTQHPHGSFLQLNQWGKLKNQFGWQAHRVWVRDQGKLVAGAQILFKSAAWGLFRIAYIPHGPLVDWNNEPLVTILFNQIDWAMFNHRASLLKMEPMLWQHETPQWETLCQKKQWRTNADKIQPPRTMIIDVTRSDEEILAAMKPKTRYNIRLAEKKGVTVREGTVADIGTFAKLLAVTGERNEFGVHSADYYLKAYQLFQPRGEAALLLAEHEGVALAAIFLVRCGAQAVYLAGASSNEGRNLMPTYAIQWAGIQWAKKHHCQWYDMWGLPDHPLEELEEQFENRDDGLWGVYRFKRGWGGNVVRTVGCADKVYNSLFYKLYQRRRAKL